MAVLKAEELLTYFQSKLSGEARRQEFIRVARREFHEINDHNARIMGVEPQVRRIVDGILGKKLEAVNQNGFVTWQWGVHLQIVDEALTLLIQHSPIEQVATDQVHYKDHHKLLVNDVEVKPPVEVGVNDIVKIVNLLPYARRIEHGWSPQASDGVYELVAEILRQKYGKLYDIDFDWEDYFGGTSIPGKEWRPKKLSQIRYPTLTIAPKGTVMKRGRRMSVAERRRLAGMDAKPGRGRPRKR